MSTPVRYLVFALLAIVAIYAGFALLKAALGILWSLLVPVAVLLAVGYVIYAALGKPSLGGGPRSLR